MPPKYKFKKKEIISAALNIARKDGLKAVTARGLALRLGCSVKPIFGLFKDMEEVHYEVLSASNQLYQEYLRENMKRGEYPPYKASGMAYIRFARKERELFKLLFMRDRKSEMPGGDLQEKSEDIKPLIELIKKDLCITDNEAYIFHLEMWVHVHGIATMIATSYLDWDENIISRFLTDAYVGLKYRFTEGKDNGGN